MSLIEQAAQRLEQLRRAGVDLPSTASEQAAHEQAVHVVAPLVPAEARRPDEAGLGARRGADGGRLVRRDAPEEALPARLLEKDGDEHRAVEDHTPSGP